LLAGIEPRSAAGHVRIAWAVIISVYQQGAPRKLTVEEPECRSSLIIGATASIFVFRFNIAPDISDPTLL